MSILPRHLHPGAWWLWALGMAVAGGASTNPVLLGLVLAVLGLVVASRRGDSPWARAFRLYLMLGAAVVVVRVLLHVLVGLKTGEHLLIRLPSPTLPSWAAGITLFGPVYLEGLLGAALEGLRLATVIAAVGAANALANPKRLLRAMPGALAEIGTAVVVSVTVAPQLADSVQRVLRARTLRGQAGHGLRAIRQVALPVLQDTLDRSLLLAASMDARGYGRRATRSPAAHALASALSLGGLLGAAVGIYGVLDTSAPVLLGLPMLTVGLTAAVVGGWLGGRDVVRSTYRPDPWAAPEWLTAAAGAAAAAAVLVSAHLDPAAMQMPLQQLALPVIPWPAVAGILLAALPAVLTPSPPAPRARAPRRAADVAPDPTPARSPGLVPSRDEVGHA
jgi:energy-coupling factor transport system permease protein